VIGGEPLTSFGVMMLLSFLTAGFLLKAEMERNGFDGERAWDFVFTAVIGGIGGAKLYYILLNAPRLLDDPAGLIFSRAGLVWYGGLIGGAILIVWQIRRFGLPLGKIADNHAPALAIAYAVGRVGCFLVGDDYGRPTDSWVGIPFPEGSPPTTVAVFENYFGVEVDPALVAEFGNVLPVHPTQLYEVGLSILAFLVLWRLRKHTHQAGWLWMLWMVFAGVERFLVEIVRVKDDRFFGAFTMAQLISISFIVIGLIGVKRLADRPDRKSQRGASAMP
jgi:phosphatidylglycerol:prolipoprotein diacylglycerol transferase